MNSTSVLHRRILQPEFQGDSRVWENRTHGLVGEVRGRCFGRTTFTLVELLVVIAIVSILAGLLLPALRRARDSAWQISCAGNQRQVGFGLESYVGDWNGYEVPRLYSGWSGTPWYTATWYEHIAIDRLDMPHPPVSWPKNNVFVCPSLAGDFGQSTADDPGWCSRHSNTYPMYCTMGINKNVTATRISRLPLRLTRVLRVTNNASTVEGWAGTTAYDDIQGPHNTGTNVLYYDSHVARIAWPLPARNFGSSGDEIWEFWGRVSP